MTKPPKKKSLVGWFNIGIYEKHRWVEFFGWKNNLLHTRYINIPDIVMAKPKFGIKVRITIEETE